MKKKTIMILALLLAAAALVGAGAWLALGKTEADTDVPRQTAAAEESIASRETVALSDAQQEEYEQLSRWMDTADSRAFAQLLLSGEISEQTFEAMVQEDQAAVAHILADALAEFAAEGELEPMVKLSEGGYLWEDCFRAYWEMTGSEEPEQTGLTATECLVYELCFAYRRDSYALRTMQDLRQDGTISDGLHQALVAALGFDYTDQILVEEKDLAPLGDLTPEEKTAYEGVLTAIDEGDGMAILEEMQYGGITPAVYRKLMAQDAETMDYLIARGIAGLVEEGEYLPMIQLRQEGFVSDACFRIYWDFMGITPCPEDGSSEDGDGVDRYLVHELKQLTDFGDTGIDMLRQIWRSGILNDDIQNRLVEELGFDYTVSYGG